MTMHGVLHPKSDIDRIYLSREMGGRRLRSCEGCIRMEENNLGWYARNSVEPLIEGVKAAETNKKDFKQMDEGNEGTMEKQKNVRTVSNNNARNNR